MKQLILNIECCFECPFRYQDLWHQFLCEKVKDNRRHMMIIPNIKTIPMWCPLEDKPTSTPQI